MAFSSSISEARMCAAICRTNEGAGHKYPRSEEGKTVCKSDAIDKRALWRFRTEEDKRSVFAEVDVDYKDMYS